VQIGGSARVIWPIHHVASVPAIMGIHGTIASVPWIFMQTVVSPERAQVPPSGFRQTSCAGQCRGSSALRVTGWRPGRNRPGLPPQGEHTLSASSITSVPPNAELAAGKPLENLAGEPRSCRPEVLLMGSLREARSRSHYPAGRAHPLRWPAPGGVAVTVAGQLILYGAGSRSQSGRPGWHKGGAERRRWPGTRVGLCLGEARPARAGPTPQTCRRSVRLTRHAKVLRAGRLPRPIVQLAATASRAALPDRR
jgi:hypothetical protein